MVKRLQDALQREKIIPSRKGTTITIFSKLQDIENSRNIYFVCKREDSIIDYLRISDKFIILSPTKGIEKWIYVPGEYCRSAIDDIISELKNRRIQSGRKYYSEEFIERYLKCIDEFLREKVTTNLQKELVQLEEGTTISISHGLQDIERQRDISFSLKGKNLAIHSITVRDSSLRLQFVNGITENFSVSKGYYKSTIDDVTSGLKNGRIQSRTEYDYGEFSRTYLKNVTKFLKKVATVSSRKQVDITDSLTTKLFNSSQSKESTTAEVEYDAQEGIGYAAIVSDQQKFHFALSETTEELKHTLEEMRRSNTSHGITTKNITDVVYSNNFTPEGTPVLNDMDVILPKLPNKLGLTSTTALGSSTLSTYIICGILGLLGATVGFGYCLWNKKNRESSYDVKEADVKSVVEDSLPEEQGSLLNETNVEHIHSTNSINLRTFFSKTS